MGTFIFIAILVVVYGVWYIVDDIHKGREEDEKKREHLSAAKRTVVKTKFIDSDHTVTQEAKVKTGSALGRAVVGDWVAGPVGAFVGASTAKQDVITHESHTTTFMVYYKDGTRKHETVENGTEIYEFYMSKLELD